MRKINVKNIKEHNKYVLKAFVEKLKDKVITTIQFGQINDSNPNISIYLRPYAPLKTL